MMFVWDTTDKSAADGLISQKPWTQISKLNKVLFFSQPQTA